MINEKYAEVTDIVRRFTRDQWQLITPLTPYLTLDCGRQVHIFLGEAA